jgi:hypothetical protein
MQAIGNGAALTKFTRQAADPGAVFIYKEGLFARAYNEGAYGFIHHVLACKPIRRFVKSAGSDRVVCGVPLTVLEKLPGFGQARDSMTDVSWNPASRTAFWQPDFNIEFQIWVISCLCRTL